MAEADTCIIKKTLKWQTRSDISERIMYLVTILQGTVGSQLAKIDTDRPMGGAMGRGDGNGAPFPLKRKGGSRLLHYTGNSLHGNPNLRQ